jgi:adenosylhomocysteine nucleosidase
VIALIAATEREARPLIAGLGAAQAQQAPFQIWRAAIAAPHREIHLVVSGVGKVAAAAATAGLLSRTDVDWLINIGACGVLVDRGDLTPGTLCQADGAVEGDHFGMGDRPAVPVDCHTLETTGLKTVVLVTVDRPVFAADWRAQLAAHGQVVDMEGAAVAWTAARYGVPCTLIKGITDTAGSADRQRLQARLDGVAAALSGKVLEIIHQSEI